MSVGMEEGVGDIKSAFDNELLRISQFYSKKVCMQPSISIS